MKYHDMPVGTVIVDTENLEVCDLLIKREGQVFTWLHILDNLDQQVTTVSFRKHEGLNSSEVAYLPEGG